MFSYSSATTIPAQTDGSTITSFVPLTTVYTFPSSCSTKYRLDGPSLMAFDPAYGIDVQTGVDCVPPAQTTWWESEVVTGTGDYTTVRSIGPIECPSDWSTLATSIKDSTSTAVMCCPSGYYLYGATAGQLAGACHSNVTSGMTMTYGSTSDDSASFTMATTTMSSSSTVGAIAIVGWNVQYVVSVTASATSTSTAISTATSTDTSTSTTLTDSSTTLSTSSNASETSGSNTGGGLSVGAKTGIGLGVGLGGIGVIAFIAALWIFARRRKAPKGRTLSELPGSTQPTQQAHFPGALRGSTTVPRELDGSSYFSSQNAHSPVELG
ncbi:hypothetical protein N7490_011174 [Penicillium lividum]|nr:hypothetical protein N7490_011174 [Penicillium lividum]